MKLIVGLGNPGRKYEKTRHNLGFVVLDALLQEWNVDWKPDKKTESLRALKITKGTEVVLAKPQTMMNASGFAVKKLFDSCQIVSRSLHDLSTFEDLWVVHDDLDLPLGKIKIRKGGSSAGHKGVESIIKELGSEDFVRFRLGIGHPQKNWKLETRNWKFIEDYVLSPFEPREKPVARRMIKTAVEAIKLALEKGVEVAATRYN